MLYRSKIRNIKKISPKILCVNMVGVILTGHEFKPQIDRAAIRRTNYPAMEENQLVTESQAHK